MSTDSSESDLADQPPSKSQVKREMHALLELGKQLIALPDGQLRQLPISDTLLEAIGLAQRTTSREALRRQVHYVGRLMRDADSSAIELQLRLWQTGNDAQTRALQRLEVLRDELLDTDDALTRLLDTHPGVDAQHLRALIRAGRKERQHNAALQPGQSPQRKHYRTLFQTLKTLIDETPQQ